MQTGWVILREKGEKYCDDSLRRLGNEFVFDRMARENVQTFQERGVRKVIVQCPHFSRPSRTTTASTASTWKWSTTASFWRSSWRREEALAAKPDTVCVSCPYCMTMFEDGLKDKEAGSVRVRDIAEVVAEGLRV